MSKEMNTTITLGGKVASSLKNAFKYSQSEANKTSDTFAKIGEAAAALGGVVAFGAGLYSVANNAMIFQDKMANVATLLDGDVTPRVQELSEEVKKLAVQTGTSTDLLTDGLYNVISAFGDSAESMKILEIANKGAVAGNATVTDSINLLSAVTKGYGDVSAEANSKASDLAFTAVKLGQTTFPELASSMGRVIPLAATLGVKQEELFGVMATLTGVTGNAAEVSTQLRSTMQGFLQPTADMTKAIQALGYENGQMALQSEDLGTILIKLRKLVNDDEVAFANLFGSIDAKNAVLALTGAQADNFADKTQAMTKAIGATDSAFAQKANTAAMASKRIQEMAKVIKINIGNVILPKIVEFGDYMVDVFDRNQDKINMLVTGFSTLINFIVAAVDVFMATWPYIEPVIVGIVGAMVLMNLAMKAGMIIAALSKAWGTAVFVLEWMQAGLKLATLAQWALNAAFAANPVGLMIIGLAALIAIGYTFYKNWEKIVNFFSNSVGKIKDFFTGKKNVEISTLATSDLQGFATGGFTNRPAIFGEAGPEAAIPLKPRNPRSISLLNQTAKMLGVGSSDGNGAIVIHFSPQISGGGNSDEIRAMLEDLFPDFVDMIDKAISEKRRLSFE